MAFIKENHIFKSTVTNARGCFSLLAKINRIGSCSDAQEVFNKLNEREQEGTTG